MLPIIYFFAVLTVVSGIVLSTYVLRSDTDIVPPERLQQLTRAQVNRAHAEADSAQADSGSTSHPWFSLYRFSHRRLFQRVATFGAQLRSRFSRADQSLLQLRLARAGNHTEHAADLHLAARFLAPVAAFVCACFLPGPLTVTGTVLPALAFIAPDLLLRRRINARRRAISNAVGDMLDLLVICVEAGLGLDQAVLRVAEELVHSHPEIHEELLQLNREQRAGKSRAQAWADAVARMDVPEMTAFSAMAQQAERFGTPIARALGDYANNVRLTRIQLAEEKAAKTTIKIIFPLALFIFPSIFIVLLGPAVLTIMRNF